jgi:DNA polymerase-3 subunit gamma/tau
MSEQALYRKYRPSKFSEVLGQDHVVSALKGALEQGTTGHAYLFAGSRGTGKTSLARIFAAELGTSDRDLHEIDAASNRGVDDVRALREEVHTLPFESSHKVYIIDEVHMLTKEAFNALLKTLEEPPRHVVFILATTEQEKLPDTIISRCQSFTFKKPTTKILSQMVKRVAKKEGYTLEASTAELISLLAAGSFRDAHGYLQQAITVSKDEVISREEVENVTGAPQSSQLLAIIDAVATRDLDTALLTVRKLSEAGGDFRTILALLLRLVRGVLLVRASASMKKELKDEYSEEEYAALEKHAAESRELVNSHLLASLLDAHMRTGTTYTPELPLELALIEHLNTDE